MEALVEKLFDSIGSINLPVLGNTVCVDFANTVPESPSYLQMPVNLTAGKTYTVFLEENDYSKIESDFNFFTASDYSIPSFVGKFTVGAYSFSFTPSANLNVLYIKIYGSKGTYKVYFYEEA